MTEARNLFTDPVPAGAGQWIMDNGNNSGAAATLSFADGRLLVQGFDDTSNAYVLRHLMDVPAGDFVLSVTARSDSSPTFFANRLITVMDTNWHGFPDIIPASALNSRAVLRFTNPVAQRVIIAFQAPNKAASVAYEKILLCTAEDYEAMLAANVEWFSGTTYIASGEA